MKRVLINDENLSLDDIDYEVIRVKGMVISNGELVIVENNNTYQLPGGHNVKGEALEDTLAREIKEELGIKLEIPGGPFMMITTYDPNYMDMGSKVCSKIYYFVVETDLEPDLDNLSLDALEKETEFNVFKIKVNELESFLNNAINDGRIDASIGREMLLVSEEFNNRGGNI